VDDPARLGGELKVDNPRLVLPEEAAQGGVLHFEPVIVRLGDIQERLEESPGVANVPLVAEDL